MSTPEKKIPPPLQPGVMGRFFVEPDATKVEMERPAGKGVSIPEFLRNAIPGLEELNKKLEKKYLEQKKQAGIAPPLEKGETRLSAVKPSLYERIVPTKVRQALRSRPDDPAKESNVIQNMFSLAGGNDPLSNIDAPAKAMGAPLFKWLDQMHSSKFVDLMQPEQLHDVAKALFSKGLKPEEVDEAVKYYKAVKSYVPDTTPEKMEELFVDYMRGKAEGAYAQPIEHAAVEKFIEQPKKQKPTEYYKTLSASDKKDADTLWNHILQNFEPTETTLKKFGNENPMLDIFDEIDVDDFKAYLHDPNYQVAEIARKLEEGGFIKKTAEYEEFAKKIEEYSKSQNNFDWLDVQTDMNVLKINKELLDRIYDVADKDNELYKNIFNAIPRDRLEAFVKGKMTANEVLANLPPEAFQLAKTISNVEFAQTMNEKDFYKWSKLEEYIDNATGNKLKQEQIDEYLNAIPKEEIEQYISGVKTKEDLGDIAAKVLIDQTKKKAVIKNIDPKDLIGQKNAIKAFEESVQPQDIEDAFEYFGGKYYKGLTEANIMTKLQHKFPKASLDELSKEMKDYFKSGVIDEAYDHYAELGALEEEFNDFDILMDFNEYDDKLKPHYKFYNKEGILQATIKPEIMSDGALEYFTKNYVTNDIFYAEDFAEAQNVLKETFESDKYLEKVQGIKKHITDTPKKAYGKTYKLDNFTDAKDQSQIDDFKIIFYNKFSKALNDIYPELKAQLSTDELIQFVDKNFNLLPEEVFEARLKEIVNMNKAGGSWEAAHNHLDDFLDKFFQGQFPVKHMNIEEAGMGHLLRFNAQSLDKMTADLDKLIKHQIDQGMIDRVAVEGESKPSWFKYSMLDFGENAWYDQLNRLRAHAKSLAEVNDQFKAYWREVREWMKSSRATKDAFHAMAAGEDMTKRGPVEILNAFEYTEPVAPKLTRGLDTYSKGSNKLDVMEWIKSKFVKGEEVDLIPSSFTQNDRTAIGFTGGPINLFLHVNPGSRSLKIMNYANPDHYGEHEWITGGRFFVEDIQEKVKGYDHIVDVYLTQKGIPSAPEKYRNQKWPKREWE